MASLTYRIKPQVETGVAPKGTPLTNLEIDDNFYNIDTEVHEKLDFPSSAGLAVSTNGDEASVARTIQVSGNGLSITNGDGIAGNPSLTLASDTNNTPNTVVYRDGNGDFTANTVRANLIAGNVYLDTGEAIIFEGQANDFEVTMLVTDPTEDRTITVPDISGALVTTGDTGTVTNTMLAGAIENAKLVNSSITIDGEAVSLGGTVSIASADFDWSGNHEFIDSNFLLKDNNDTTKKFGFQLSGLPTSTTVNLVVPNENLQVIATRNYVDTNTVASSGDTMTGFLTLHSNPTSNLHAATKQYVDAAVASDADIKWVGLTGDPNASLAAYSTLPKGSIVAMQYRFTQTYWAGNGNATRTVNDYRIYIKTSTSNTWTLLSSRAT
jgi:hypothetical protein